MGGQHTAEQAFVCYGFSGAKAEEVIEIALAFVDEVPATRLMKKAIDSGVRFSAEDVMEVIDWVRADFRLPLAESAAIAFTEENIDYLDTLLPKKSVDALARRSGVAHEAEEPVRREQAAFRERKRRPGAFGAFFAALGAGGIMAVIMCMAANSAETATRAKLEIGILPRPFLNG